MNNYYFEIERAVLKVRADSLEDAQEELQDFIDGLEQCDYDTEPIDVE